MRSRPCLCGTQRGGGSSRVQWVAGFYLNAIHAQGSQLLSGGVAAFHTSEVVAWHPVIVNAWQSSCDNRETEFSVFQRAAVSYGRRVASIGIDAKDSRGAATTMLKRFPVTYPSYADPQGRILTALRTLEGVPQTFFFNARGCEVYDHASADLTFASLRRDIHYYLGP